MKKLATLCEVFFGIELDREWQSCRSHDSVGLGGEQVIIEVPIVPTAGNRKITGTQTLSQLRQHTVISAMPLSVARACSVSQVDSVP